jgi:hypothetical protein
VQSYGDPFIAFDQLARIEAVRIDADPPFSALLTLDGDGQRFSQPSQLSELNVFRLKWDLGQIPR